MSEHPVLGRVLFGLSPIIRRLEIRARDEDHAMGVERICFPDRREGNPWIERMRSAGGPGRPPQA